ncbi:amidase family protein [Streptomyces sp. Lzd4kr]|nr:amidase family protein [Streptomyces sp. Lzd4kr]
MSTSELASITALELAKAVRGRQISPVEITMGALEAADRLNPTLNAYLAVDPDQALAQARQAEHATLGDPDLLGPLHGVPVSVKDLEPTRGLASSSGAAAYAGHVPEEDSALVSRLRDAGAIILGKTNTPLFGLLGETRNRLGADARNPWDTTRTTGGSSGGSAAAVAAGITPVATGTDSAGSINCPAGMCGVYGIKPSHGRVPMVPDGGDALLFNDGGPLARTVADAALMLAVMAGHDPRDPVSLRSVPPHFRAAVTEPTMPKVRVCWSPHAGHFPVDPEVRAVAERAATRFAELGCELVLAHPPVPNPWEIYTPLYVTDVRVALSSFLSDHAAELFPETTDELEAVPPLSAEEYVRAYHRLLRFRSTMADFFEQHTLLLTPTTAVAAFPCGQPPSEIGGQAVRPGWTTFMPFQIMWNMTGQPVASVPAGFTASGLPVGLQIVGPVGREDLVLAASAAYELAAPWSHLTPPVSAATQPHGK